MEAGSLQMPVSSQWPAANRQVKHRVRSLPAFCAHHGVASLYCSKLWHCQKSSSNGGQLE